MNQIILETIALRSEYDNVRETNDAYLNFREGEMSALLGDRDSGRLSFFDCICGRTIKTSGNIKLYGHPCSIEELNENVHLVSDSESISLYHFCNITVADYLFLMCRDGCAKISLNYESKNSRGRKLLEIILPKHSLLDDIGTLSQMEFLLLKIGKGLIQGANIIALEEDFEGYSEADISILRSDILLLKEVYPFCIVWSTNGQKGVTELADKCILFKGGNIIKQMKVSISQIMDETNLVPFNRDTNARSSFYRNASESGPVFQARGLKLSDVYFDLSVYPGELISIIEYDVEKKNQLYHTLIGTRSGQLYFRNRPLPVNWRFQHETFPIIGLDQYGIKGMFPELSPTENLILPSMRKASRPGIVLPEGIFEAAFREWKKQHPSSEGNLQRMSRSDRLSLQLESWLIFHPAVLILLEPFLHLDQQGRGIFSQYFSLFRKRDTAIIVLSSSKTNYLAEDSAILKVGLFDHEIYYENGAIVKTNEYEKND